VARVIELRPAMLGIFGVLLNQRFSAAKTRVHGDLHLGQLLNTGKEFVFIDFEGSAERPIGERALRRCPLVDLAAMLRSLDYAAAAALHREAEADRETLRSWATHWTQTMMRTLADSYFAATDGVAFIPPEPADRYALLTAYLLDRALREIAHELNGSGEFVGVPLSAVAELLAVSPAMETSRSPHSPSRPAAV